jgi:hypothetical protein
VGAEILAVIFTAVMAEHFRVKKFVKYCRVPLLATDVTEWARR